ncbi:OmpL47-type beta-barrel domain-containing protein [Paenibacillus mesotrionivorans]|uniref:OmpL47-type beta-barrel domain-containing protein n=1 Tax=Paenibacillus mesotrionivorans TaxID=3160968 RepID=A0ACC7NW53_9BACL
MKKLISLFMCMLLIIMELSPLVLSNLISSAYADNLDMANLNQDEVPYFKDQVSSVANSTYTEPTVISGTYSSTPILFPSTSVTTDTYNKLPTLKYIVTYASIDRKQNKKAMKFFRKSETSKVLRSFKNIPQELMLLSEPELAELRMNPDIINVEPDYSVSLSGVENSSNEATTLSYEGLNGEQLFSMKANGQGIRVGIIDSGIDIHHPDLLVSGGVSLLDDTYNDANGHGTEIAGIIAAQLNDFGIKGLAPNAEVYALKAFNASGTASHSDIIAAIDWAIENHINILNMSFGGKENGQALQSATQAAWDAGILLVSASGNKGQSTIEYPAAYSSVMAVGAVNNDLTLAPFSNYGDKLELVSFGSNIYTTTLNSSYRLVSGTSYAAAQVTASAAALWSYHPDWNAEMVRTALLNSSTAIGEQNMFGYGLVNPLGAVKGQFPRDVTVDFEGTVSGAVYGNFFTKLSYLNKTPQDPYTMKQGQITRFSVTSEDDIVDYYTGVFNSENVKIQEKYVSSGTGLLPAGSLLFHDFITNASTPVGTYTVKISPCFDTSGGIYGCPKDSAIKWDVILEPPVGPDTEKPNIQSLKPDQTYFELYKPITLRASASDNRGVKKMTFWYSIELSNGEWGSDYYIGETPNSPVSTNMTSSIDWTPTQNGGYYRFKVVAYDEAGNSSWYSTGQKFYVNPDITPPRVGLSYDQSARLMSNYEIPISFSAFDDGGISEMYLRIYQANDPESQFDLNNNNIECKLNSSVTDKLIGGYGTFSWLAYTSGWHRISIVAVDGNGNKTEEMITPHSFTDIYIATPTVVFVPGFLNTRLKSGGQTAWIPDELLDSYGEMKKFNRVVTEMNLSTIVSKLTSILLMDNNGNSYNDVSTFGIIQDGPAKDVGTLLYNLRREGINVAEVAYDWRLDVTSNEVQNAIASTVERALQKTHGQPISIVTYSMGALPVRKFLLDHQYEQGMNIDSLINIAPPSLGTFYGFKGIEMGDDLGIINSNGFFTDAINSGVIKPFLHNMASVYQLMPGELYNTIYQDKLGQQAFYTDNKSVQNYSELLIYMDNNESFNSKLIERGRTFRSFIEDSGHYVKPEIKKFVFAGYKRNFESSNPDLWEKADPGADIIGMSRSYKYRYGYENAPINFPIPYKDTFYHGVGDGVVPLKSASFRFERDTNVYYVGRMHTSIVGDGKVNSAIKEIVLTGATTQQFITDPDQIPIVGGTSLTINCPVNVSVHDANGNYAGLDENGSLVNNISELSYDIIGETKTLFVPEGVNLDININGYDTGTMDIDFIDYEKDKPITANTIIDVRIINGTKLSFSFNALIEDNKDVNILYDFRGDGQTTVLHPGQQIPFDQLMNDEVPPVSILLIEPALHNNWTGGGAVISLSATDAASGVSGIYYQLDGGPETEYKAPFTVEGAGGHEITYFAMDYSGNIEERRTQIVQIDMTAPGKPLIVPTTTDWTNQDVLLTIIHGEDMGSGAHKSQYKIGAEGQWHDYTEPFTVSDDGANTIFARTLDWAGNVSEEVNVTVLIDKVAPNVPTIEATTTDWTFQDVTVELTGGLDFGSGLKELQYKLGPTENWATYSGPMVITAEGLTEIQARAVDIAGNLSRESAISVKIDKVAPTSPRIEVSTKEWTNQTVVMEVIQGTDDRSGIKKTQYKIGSAGNWMDYSVKVSLEADGEYDIFARSLDHAGNISTEAWTTVRIDKTAPSVPALAPSQSGWTNQDVAVTLTAGTDVLSGVLKSQYRIGEQDTWKDYVNPILIHEEGVHSVNARTLDVAGNISQLVSINVKIDRTPPSTPTELELTGKNETSAYFEFQAAADNLSEITYEIHVNDTWTRDESKTVVGLHSLRTNTYHHIQVRARDEAGNLSALSAPIEVLTNNPISHRNGSTLLLHMDGTVWAWGNNRNGQAGDGTMASVKTTAGKVKGLDSVVAVSAGAYDEYGEDINYSVALKRDGTVWVWGNQKGYGYIVPVPVINSLPVQIPGLDSVNAIDANGSSIYAVKADGTVWKWGFERTLEQLNITDAIGVYNGIVLKRDGTAWTEDLYYRFNQISGIDNISVVAGSSSTLFLKEDGTVWEPEINNNQYQVSKVTFPENVKIIAIATDEERFVEKTNFALSDQGEVWIWGLHTEYVYRAGDGALSENQLYIDVPRKEKIGQASSLSGNRYSYVIAKEGDKQAIWTYGRNYRGEHGNGTTETYYGSTKMLYNTKPLTAFISATKGTLNAPYEVTIADGRVYWHLEDAVQTVFTAYQLQVLDERGEQIVFDTGIQNRVSSSSAWSYRIHTEDLPENQIMQYRVRVKDSDDYWSDWSEAGWLRVEPAAVSGEVAGSGSHSLLLKEDGTVWAWGRNENGELGDRTTMNRSTPVQVEGFDKVIHIRAGNGYSMAIKQDGTLWGWGNSETIPQLLGQENTEGFGYGGVYSRIVAINQTGDVKYDWPLIKTEYSSAVYDKAILTDSGDVFFTKNSGQISYSKLVLQDVIDIAVGADHYLALKHDGTVWAWGKNQDGQLGIGIKEGSNYHDTPVLVEGIPPIRKIFAKENSSKAIDQLGVIWNWGRLYGLETQGSDNPYPTLMSKATPQVINSMEGFKTLAIGSENHLIAYRNDDDLYGSGLNLYGSLGDGTQKLSLFTKVAHTPLPMPVARLTVREIEAILSWDGVPGATHYFIQVDNGAVERISGTSYYARGLSAGVEHIFQVQAVSADNASAWTKVPFFTLPDVPRLIDSSSTSSSIQLNWASIVGADSYEVEVNGIVGAASGNSFLQTGLLPNSLYEIRVRSIGKSGYSDWSIPLKVQTRLVTPVLKRDISNASSITLSWTATSGATGYNIKADDRVIELGGVTSFTDSSLEPNSPHSYQVQAVLPTNWSDWSEMMSTSTAPGRPNASSISGSSFIEVKWPPVVGAVGYDVEFDGTVESVSGESYKKEELSPNSSHTIRIRARNDIGTGDWGTPIQALTRLASVTIDSTSSTSSSITLEWLAVPDAQGYRLLIDGLEKDVENATVYIHEGLVPNTQHRYQIKALSTNNSSEWSEECTTSTLIMSTDKPVVVPADTSISISWNEVSGAIGYELEINGEVIKTQQNIYTKSGLSPNTVYTIRVRWKTAEQVYDWSEATVVATLLTTPIVTASSLDNSIILSWSPVLGASAYLVSADGVVVSNGDSCSYIHPGLYPNTSHSYSVQAITGTNSSKWSITAQKYTSPPTPTAPTASATLTDLSVTWMAVSGASSYDVEVNGVVVATVSSPSYKKSGLSQNTGLTIRVRSKNNNGSSSWSPSVTAYTLLNVPVISSVTVNSSSITLAWNQVSGATGYRIKLDDGYIYETNALSYTIIGLSPNTAHTVQIYAYNANTTSTWTSVMNKTTAPAIPAIIGVNVQINSFTLNWTSSPGASGYDVELNGTISSVSGTSLTKTGLQPNTSLVLRVRSKNSSGVSEWSETLSNIATKLVVPVATGTSTSNSISLTWPNVSGATGYNVKLSSSSYQSYTVFTNSNSFFISGSPGSSHTYQVQAVSSTNSSDWSSPVTRFMAPAKPNSPTAVATTTSLQISWGAVAGATGYDLEVDGTVISVSGTSYTKSGLLTKTYHQVRVRSKNSGGVSDWTSIVTFRTL